MPVRSLAIAAFALSVTACASHAAPDPDPAGAPTPPSVAGVVESADQMGLDLRRTTLVVADIERSLAFYRDTLGMVPIYDNVIRTPADAASIEEAELERRLVLLRANNSYIGVLGLLEYFKPDRPADPQDPAPFQPGDVVLLFNAEDAAASYAAAIALDGVTAVREPTEVAYPSYDGEGVIRVLTSIVLDPDGHAVELNQLLSELR